MTGRKNRISPLIALALGFTTGCASLKDTQRELREYSPQNFAESKEKIKFDSKKIPYGVAKTVDGLVGGLIYVKPFRGLGVLQSEDSSKPNYVPRESLEINNPAQALGTVLINPFKGVREAMGGFSDTLGGLYGVTTRTTILPLTNYIPGVDDGTRALVYTFDFGRPTDSKSFTYILNELERSVGYKMEDSQREKLKEIIERDGCKSLNLVVYSLPVTDELPRVQPVENPVSPGTRALNAVSEGATIFLNILGGASGSSGGSPGGLSGGSGGGAGGL
jgi:hypothetical protein